MHNTIIIGATTPDNMISVKYDRAKAICYCMWDQRLYSWNFEDVFHDTIYRCLLRLGHERLDQDYMKNYFFKAFRINMVRHFGYAHNRLKSGVDMDSVIIPVECDYIGRMDGFQMMSYVMEKCGKDAHDMLWDNLNGYTYQELNKKYDTNSFYVLGKIKAMLKKQYSPIKVVKVCGA